MADEIDRAQERDQELRDQALAARPKAYLRPGVPGECDFCGKWSGRLVGAACARCRDRYKLD